MQIASFVDANKHLKEANHDLTDAKTHLTEERNDLDHKLTASKNHARICED